MPGPLVLLTGVSRPEHRDDAGNKIRRAGQNERDGPVEAERANGGGEEVLESVGRDVHVLHEHEHPEPL